MQDKVISLEDFQKVDMRVGTIIDAKENKGARVPAYALRIDFGPDLGQKSASAQITDLYQPTDLIGRQIIAVTNFPPIKISSVKSEVLVLGADSPTGVILLSPDTKAPNGAKIH